MLAHHLVPGIVLGLQHCIVLVRCSVLCSQHTLQKHLVHGARASGFCRQAAVTHLSSAFTFLAACALKRCPNWYPSALAAIFSCPSLCPAVQSFEGAQQSPQPAPSTDGTPILPILPPTAGADMTSTSTGSSTTLGAYAQCGGIADGHTEDAAWPGYSCTAPAMCQRWSSSWWQCRTTAFGRRLLQ